MSITVQGERRCNQPRWDSREVLVAAGRSGSTWALRELLSTARMGPYVATVSGGDWSDALALYDWNVRIGAAFFEDLHYIEVGLRNAMDLALVDYAASSRSAGPWFTAPALRLSPGSRRVIAKARARATDDGALPEVHGKVVAELSFGFWWSLLSDNYNRSLWAPCLKNAFDGQVRRQRLHAALDQMRVLRNRIAHHEPLHTRDLAADHHVLLDTAGRIAVPLKEHIESVTRVPEILSLRPSFEERDGAPQTPPSVPDQP